MGTFPGAGYYLHHAPETKRAFAELLAMAGFAQQVTIDDTSVQARLHAGAGGNYLWITNPTRSSKSVTVKLAPSAGSFKSGEDIWGKQAVTLDGGKVTVTVPERDALVLALA